MLLRTQLNKQQKVILKKEEKNYESTRLNINSMRYKYKQCEIRCFDCDNFEQIANFLSNGMPNEN